MKPDHLATPEHLAQSVGPTRIDFDRPCARCGYNLIGLELDGTCPECGTKITETRRRRPPRFADQLIHAPPPWLSNFRLAGLVLAGSGSLLFGCLLLFSVSRFAPFGVIALGASAAWYWGCLLITRPRPEMPWMEEDPHREWATHRAIVRGTQGAWALGIAMLVFETTAIGTGAGGPILRIVGLALLGGAVAGAGVMTWYASNLAYWGADSRLGDALRGSSWMLGIGGFTGAFALGLHEAIISLAVPAMGVGPWWRVIAFLLTIPTIAYVVVTLLRLDALSAWVISSHTAAKERLERFREKVRQEAEYAEWERARRPAAPELTADLTDTRPDTPMPDPSGVWRHPDEGYIEPGGSGEAYDVDPPR